MATLPLPDSSCDTVVCIDGIEHISRQFDFVKEFYRILRKQGEFILSTANISALRLRWKWFTTGHHHKCNSPVDENNPTPLHHIGMISFPEIRYLFPASGFKLSEVETDRLQPISWFYILFLPFICLSAFWLYYRAGKKATVGKVELWGI